MAANESEKCWGCGRELVPGQAVRKLISPGWLNVFGYAASYGQYVRICWQCAQMEADHAAAIARQEAEAKAEAEKQGCMAGIILLALVAFLLFWLKKSL
jgi:hypothetical protein